MKKIFVSYNSFFWSLLFVVTIIIMSPLLIKITLIKNIVNYFLVDLHSMKGDYLGMLGTLMGSSLAITGALWTQRKINYDYTVENIKKTARLIVFDFERNYKAIRTLYISDCFNFDRVIWKIKLIEKWDEKLLEISQFNEIIEIDYLIKFYEDIHVLSCFIDKILYDNNEIEEETFSYSYQSPMNASTKRRNITIDKYIEERSVLVERIAKRIISKNILDEINNDKIKIKNSIQEFENLESELYEFEKKNKLRIHDDQLRPIDSIVKEEHQRLKDNLKNKGADVNNLRQKIEKTWKIKLESIPEDNEIDSKYENLINSIKNIYL